MTPFSIYQDSCTIAFNPISYVPNDNFMNQNNSGQSELMLASWPEIGRNRYVMNAEEYQHLH